MEANVSYKQVLVANGELSVKADSLPEVHLALKELKLLPSLTEATQEWDKRIRVVELAELQVEAAILKEKFK